MRLMFPLRNSFSLGLLANYDIQFVIFMYELCHCWMFIAKFIWFISLQIYLVSFGVLVGVCKADDTMFILSNQRTSSYRIVEIWMQLSSSNCFFWIFTVWSLSLMMCREWSTFLLIQMWGVKSSFLHKLYVCFKIYFGLLFSLFP